MAWAKGTATDFIDALRKMRDFAIGTLDPLSHVDFSDGSGVVPLADRWVVLANGVSMPTIPVSGFGSDGELYLKGPGSSALDEIIVGIRTSRNVGANIFQWEARGYTAFDDTLTFSTLPGVSPSSFTSLDDASMDIWLYVNARRIMAAFRIGTTDIVVHFGFVQQFGTRNQYPYPLLITGSVDGNTRSFQTNNYAHSCMPDPCENGAFLRWVDGSWMAVTNYSGSSEQRGQARKKTGACFWPQRNPATAAEGGETGSLRTSEDTVFEAFSTGTPPYISSSQIGAYAIFSTVLMTDTALIGRVDGAHVVFGLGLVAGDTLTDSSVSPADVYDVFKNTWRSEPVDFIALKRA